MLYVTILIESLKKLKKKRMWLTLLISNYLFISHAKSWMFFTSQLKNYKIMLTFLISYEFRCFFLHLGVATQLHPFCLQVLQNTAILILSLFYSLWARLFYLLFFSFQLPFLSLLFLRNLSFLCAPFFLLSFLFCFFSSLYILYSSLSSLLSLDLIKFIIYIACHWFITVIKISHHIWLYYLLIIFDDINIIRWLFVIWQKFDCATLRQVKELKYYSSSNQLTCSVTLKIGSKI